MLVGLGWNFLDIGSFDPTEHSMFQAAFGMIFTVIIALEFKRSLLVVAERRESIVQVRTVVLLAMLAILRKLIILDLDSTDSGKLLGLSAAMLALGIVYWLVRDQDRSLAPERRGGRTRRGQSDRNRRLGHGATDRNGGNPPFATFLAVALGRSIPYGPGVFACRHK